MIVNYLVFGVNKLAMPTHLTLIKRMKHVYLEWWMRSISRKVWIYNDEMPGTNPQAFHATQYNELQRLIFHSPIITAIVVKLIFVCLSCLVKWKRLRLCESKCRNIILIRSIVKIKTPTIVAEFWNFCWFILGNKNSLEIPFIACRFKRIFLLICNLPPGYFLLTYMLYDFLLFFVKFFVAKNTRQNPVEHNSCLVPVQIVEGLVWLDQLHFCNQEKHCY